MPGVFGQIGSVLKKNPLGSIGAGISGLTSFLANRQKNKYLQDQINYQKFLRGLTTDPAKMSQYIAGFEKPLSAGLVKGVENEVQAYGAERGLSTSPQIMDEILAQALGPYQLQSQGQGIEAALRSLGLPSASPEFGNTTMDISGLIKQLLQPGTTINTIPKGGGVNTIPRPDTEPDMEPPIAPGWPGYPEAGGMGFDDAAFAGMF